MKIDFIYGNPPMCRQWDFDAGGHATIFLDAVLATDASAPAVVKKSIAVHDLVALVHPFEDAQAVVVKGQPDNGVPKTVPDPAWIDPGDGSVAPRIANPDWALQPTTDDQGWTAYNAAVSRIAAASAVTVAHALWRAGEPLVTALDDHAAWSAAKATVLADFATRAAADLVIDPRPVPPVVALWQARAILTATGLFAAADAAIRAGANAEVIAMWDYGNTLDRSSPTLAALGADLNLDAAHIDTLFREASALEL